MIRPAGLVRTVRGNIHASRGVCSRPASLTAFYVRMASPLSPSAPTELDPLVDLLRGRRTVVLSGAGCSTESGIPDYRGPETRKKARNPIQYRAFVSDAEARTHYWARSAIGWPRFSAAQPNDGHRALAALEHSTLVSGVITQNVDRLHHAAGSRAVVELHGALDEVACLGCGQVTCRHAMQERLLALNPGWLTRSAELAPDGDAELMPAATRTFRVPPCNACGGVLKPHVVFFGESVPKDRTARAWQMLDEADALLVVGSSLAVYSGYRFVLGAAKAGKPIGIVNLGSTRGDDLAAVRIEDQLGTVLPRLTQRLAIASPFPRAGSSCAA